MAVTGLESIKLRALALRSSIYNERTYTATEMAGQLALKTNELIDVVNDLVDQINTLENTQFSLRYDADHEELLLGTEVE